MQDMFTKCESETKGHEDEKHEALKDKTPTVCVSLLSTDELTLIRRVTRIIQRIRQKGSWRNPSYYNAKIAPLLRATRYIIKYKAIMTRQQRNRYVHMALVSPNEQRRL